uniref:Uncharacterized protein n=1 Tax=Coccidioides posadasii RMSCC 3488 TaxID=454284 RepID=A0A0J6FQA5_COCPO|nr:hypothetical protein CPAG_07476 [Coccidioides posadasii RMSCC 3488]
MRANREIEGVDETDKSVSNNCSRNTSEMQRCFETKVKKAPSWKQGRRQPSNESLDMLPAKVLGAGRNILSTAVILFLARRDEETRTMTGGRQKK